MPFTYRQVKDLYDQLKSSGATSVSLPEWSDEMNRLTGTDLYGEGRNDNLLKRGSVGLDRALEWTGIPTATQELGRAAGSLVGNPEAGADIGENLPRMAANFAPLAASAFFPPAAPFALAATGLLSGSEAYTKTGSPAAGLVTAGLNMALPGVTNAAEQAVLRQMGVKSLGKLTSDFATDAVGNITRLATKDAPLEASTLAQKLASFGGGQAAAAGLMEGQRWGEEYFSGEPLHNPFTTENLLNYTLGQLPFAVTHGVTKLAGLHSEGATAEAVKLTEQRIEQKRAQDALAEQTDVEKIPVVSPAWTPEQINDLTTRRSSLRQQQEAITSKPTLLPEDIAKLNDLVAADNATPNAVTPTSALGAEQRGEHTEVIGRQLHETSKWRKVYVSDIEGNPPELRGKVVEYSKGLREPAPTPLEEGSALSKFGVTSDPLWRTVREKADEDARQALYASKRASVPPENRAGTPELPEQTAPASDYFSHITDLDNIEVAVDAAKTPAQMQKALLDLRRLQDSAGREPFNDQQLLRVQQKLAEKGPKIDPVKAAIKREAAKLRRQMNAEEEALKRKAVRDDTASDAIGENAGTHNQQPIVALPKLDGDTQPSHDRVDELISGVEKDKDAVESFNLWQKGGTSKDETSLPKELQRFMIYYRMKASGELGAGEVLSDSEARTFNDELKADGLGAEDASVLRDFPERDHILNWNDRATQNLLDEQRSHAPVPQQIKPLKAGGPFVWGLAGYDEVANKLGGKHTLPKSGEVTEAQLKAIGGKGKPLQDVEIEMMKGLDEAVKGGAFDGKGNVNIKTLQKVLKENPVVVESHEYGMEGKPSEAKAKFDQLTHDWWETLNRHQQAIVEGFAKGHDDEARVQEEGVDPKIAREFVEVRKIAQSETASEPRATSYYRQISPFDTEKYPVTRIDVVLPTKNGPTVDYTKARPGETNDAFADRMREDHLWHADGLHENLLNTLGWAMVQFVPDPKTGETVMFVGEQQSRWGQQKSKETTQWKQKQTELKSKLDEIKTVQIIDLGDMKSVILVGADGKPVRSFEGSSNIEDAVRELSNGKHEFTPELRAKAEIAATERRQELFGGEIADHPLLPSQHLLVLKAAIAEAAKRGVSKIVVSDGESAMMTEGHDKAVDYVSGPTEASGFDVSKWEVKTRNNTTFFSSLEEAQKFADEHKSPPQSGGMRLHYDTTLPSTLRTLTGEKGERVELGVHKNADLLSNRSPWSIETSDLALPGPKTYTVHNHETGETKQFATGEAADDYIQSKSVGSPVFREASGSPKSSVTGLSFDLSRAQQTFADQGGFTLGDPARAPKLPEPQKYTSDVASQQDIISRFTTDGHGVVRELLTDLDPNVRNIATDLLTKFPEALLRVDSGIYEVPGSFAARRPASRVGLFFDRSFANASPSVRNNIALHELIHGITLHEILSGRGDPKVLSELTSLRERLIEALPKKMKAKLQEAVDSDWYNRYTEGLGHMEELHTEGVSDRQATAQAQVIYALLSDTELASQAFSSGDVKAYMQTVKGEKRGKTLWNTFTSWVKGALKLDKIDETAFGDFLSITSALTSHGEFLSSFANFGERYFEAQGQGGTYGRAQTDRALGIVANSAHGLNEPLTLATSLDFGAKQNKTNLELRKASREYENLLRNSEDDKIHIDSVLGELGHKNIDELVTSAIGDGEDISSALDILPPEATNYVYEKLKDAHDVLDVIRAAASEKNKGMVNLANPKLLRDSVAPVLKQIKKALKHEEFQQEMGASLAGLGSVTPEGFLDSVPSMAPKAYEDLIEGAKDIGGKSLAALTKFLEPVGQWTRRVPEVAEATSKGFQLAPNARKMFHESVKWLGMDTSNPYVDALTHESTKEAQHALSTPKLNDRVSKWMFWNNKKGGDAVTMLPENDPDVAKALAGLSAEDKAIVHNTVAKAGKLTQMLNAQKLEKMNQMAATAGGETLAYVTGLKTRDNVALARDTLLGIQQSEDPMNAQRGNALLQGVQQRMQPDAFIELYDFLKGEADKIKLWKTYFDANPNWATAQRTERFLVYALDKQNKAKTLQASTRKEAQDTIAKKGYKLNPAKEEPIKDQWAGREDEPFAFPNMSPEMAKRMQEIEDNQMAMLSKTMSPEDLAEVRRTSAVSQVLREATAQKSIPDVNTPPRLLSQGAEELPWMWNHISWAQRESNYWSRQLLRAQARTYLKDVEIRALPDSEQQKLKTHFENLLQPDPQIAQKITRLNSTWFLGYNLATSLINAAQPFVTHVSELTALTGKPIDSYRRVTRALDEIAGKFVGKKDWSSSEHEKLMHEAVKDGEVGIGMFDDEAAAQEAIATNFKRAMKKEAPQTLGQKLGTAAGAYTTAGMWLFQHGERVNSRAALLAGYDYYREQGLSFSEAKEKAYEFNHTVNFGGGRAQRSIGAYSSRSPFLRGAAMLGTSLQSYVLGTTAQIARYLQRGFFRPDRLTPHETYAARRAAIQMLATQFAAAGVLGMPFVSGAIALLDKAFPELELNRKLREGVNDFLSSDKENGSVLTDIAMTGVPSSFGWDMQSRLSMGNTLPGVSEVNGFQPENLLGPTANLVRNFVNGTTGFVKGEPRAASNFLPPAVRKLVEAGAAALSSGQAGGGIQDYQGRPLAEPTRGEYLGSFLGFQPKRLSDQNAAARILKQSEEVLRTQESRFRQQQAEQVLQGNFGTVREELRARKQSEKAYDDVGAVQSIARAAEELAFPRDLRNEGTRQGSRVRGALLESYGAVGNQTSEVQRLEFRKNIEQKLGLVGDNRKELQVAALMDGLRGKDPDATRIELKSAAIEAMRHVSRVRQLSPLESQ